MEKFISTLETKAKTFCEEKSYQNAIFYAEKLISVKKDLGSLHLLFDCFYASGQYKRVYHLIKKTYHDECQDDIKSIHLASKCLEQIGQWEELLRHLGDENTFAHLIEHGESKYIPSLCFLRAKTYDRLDNKKKALMFYYQALNRDPYMMEAYEAAIILLKHSDQIKLFNSLNLQDDWLKLIYQSKIDSFQVGSKEIKALKTNYGLEKNIDIMLREAETYFNAQKFSQADALAKQIMKLDPFNTTCLPLYINILVELGRKSELYNLANEMVSNDSKSALAWYAVGSYYYSVKKFEQARKFFQKSTQLDSKFVPSWIALGHSYAFTDETDFAMNAYRTGARLHPGSHIPPLCIGIESIKTGTLMLGESNLMLAKEICDSDPVVFNEFGVIQYKMGQYKNAIKYFQMVIKLSPEDETQVTSTKSLEIAHYNLGHSFRKMEMYEDAIRHYELAQKISHDGSVESALGFTYHLKGDYQKAIEYYHKGLALNPDDSFINEMIPKALSQFAK